MRPAIGENRVAGDVAGVLTGKEEGNAADVGIRVAHAAHGIGCRGGCRKLRLVRGELLVSGGSGGRADDVGADSEAGPFARSGSGIGSESFLSDVVIGCAHMGVDSVERADV